MAKNIHEDGLYIHTFSSIDDAADFDREHAGQGYLTMVPVKEVRLAYLNPNIKSFHMWQKGYEGKTDWRSTSVNAKIICTVPTTCEEILVMLGPVEHKSLPGTRIIQDTYIFNRDDNHYVFDSYGNIENTNLPVYVSGNEVHARCKVLAQKDRTIRAIYWR